MPEKVSITHIEQRIGDLLDRVALRHEAFIIEREGKALAALVPVGRLEQMRRYARRHALEVLEHQAGGPLSDGQATGLALEAKRWARERSPKEGNA